jgi:TonB-dependent receptor
MHTRLKSFASAGYLALLAIGLTPSFGQVAPAPADQTATASSDQATKDDKVVQLNTFTVSGLRGSLASAEEIKESSQEIVDSIVASDIDKLPDINVSYALARIPDVQLAHTFSGLGGNGAVTIDGLNQIVSTLDGHEVTTPGGIANGTAGVGVGQRTFDYSQIPSALVAGIDVYRTSAANQIDGGLSGVIDVRMRKPFDFANGFGFGGTFGTTYSALKDGENQNYNLFADFTGKTAFGRMGVLISVSDITTPWREDNIGIGNPTPDATVTTGVPTALTTTGYTNDSAYGEFVTEGFNAVFQWQPTPNLEVHVGYNPNKWRNFQDESEFAAATPVSAAVAGSGSMFAGSTTATQSATFNNVTGTAYGLIRDLVNQLNMLSLGGKFTSGNLTINFDGDHYTSSNRFYNNLVFASISIPSVSYNLGGQIPSITYAGVSLEDPTQYHLSQVDYRLYPSNADGKAGKIDGEYDFGKSLITKVLAGVRYSQTTNNNYPTGLFLGSYNIPASSNLLSQHPGLWVQNPIQNIFPGYDQTQIQQYLVQNTAFMRNADALFQDYGATNTPDTSATVNPLSLFSIKESTTAAYLMPEYGGTIAGMNFDGNFGVRMVRTEEDAAGFQGATAATAVPLNLASSYSDWLPSFNFRLKLTDTLFFRAAAAKTISRPSFSQLSPSLVLNANPVNPSLNSGSQGNPSLQPVRSTNYNIAFEYYPQKSSVFYAGLFKKDVKGFIGSFSQPETYSGVTYEIQTYSNLSPASIQGYDVGFQHFFTSLPSPFDGLGLQANYTYVDSSTPTTVSGVGLPVNAPLQNLSKQSYNLILIYEKGPFSARVGYNYRTSFVTGFAYYVNTGLLDQELAGYGDLDASLNYSITKNLELAIQGVNLTNTLRYQYFGSKLFPSNIYLDGAQLMTSVTLRF